MQSVPTNKEKAYCQYPLEGHSAERCDDDAPGHAMRAVALQVHIGAILLHISPNPLLLPDVRVRWTGGRCI
jgi:hypothetical protein